MKQIIRTTLLLLTTLVFLSCNNGNIVNTSYYCPMKCEGEKLYAEGETCPICKMDLIALEDEKIVADENDISDASIFNLTSKWNTQDNETIALEELKGDVLVMVMIYTTCKAACPRLVADMRNIHAAVDHKDVKYVLVSIDPENDTPERLKEFAIENKMDNDNWIFLQGGLDDVREFSNVLSVKYKQISPIDFSHSNIISVFTKGGELHHQQEGLGVDNTETVNKIKSLLD
jgi:protein SCO1/2